MDGTARDDAAAVAAVAAAWATLRDKLLAAESQTSVSAVSRFNVDFGLVDEHRPNDQGSPALVVERLPDSLNRHSAGMM